MSSTGIVPLQETHLAEAARALARAFHADPLQGYVLPDPIERAARSPAHFAPFIRYGLLFGEVLTTADSCAGASVWLGPAQWEVTPERAEAAGIDKLADAIGEVAATRFLSVLAAIDPFHQRDMPGPHYYLMILGVAPEHHGTGLGRALMQPVLDRADATGLPCYLETAQPANVSFYEHLGFQTLVETTDRDSGLRLWTFRRDPVTR